MTPWARTILFATVAITLADWLLQIPRQYLALVPVLVPQFPWTPLTYMFVHGGMLHLAFNMIALYFFGPRLEVRLGSAHFVSIYIISGLTGALFSVIDPFSEGRVPIVGASGAVLGVMYGFARYWPRERIMIWAVLPVEARKLVLILATFSVVAGIIGVMGGVAHFAHLGGLAGGYVYLKIMEARSPARRFKQQASGVRRSAGGADLERWSGIRREGLHEINIREIDRLLDKARSHGPSSLTPDERAYLDRMSS